MPVIFTLKDIDEAIDSLNYRSETTFKSKLIHAVRSFYEDESSTESLNFIDTEQLVKFVWETGEDVDLIKNRRKNFSSIKSSVNNDLKKLYAEGKNPQGIVISHNNIFDISDEAKNKTLSSIAGAFREKGIDTQSKITEILNALSDISGSPISATEAAEAREEIDRLQNIIGELSGKFGLPIPQGSVPEKTSAQEGAGAKADGESGIKIFGEETGEGKGAEGDITEEAGGNTAAGIAAILQDKEIDSPSKMNKIMEVMQGILSDAVASAGQELNNAEAEQIKYLFGDLPGKLRGASGQESGFGAGDVPVEEVAISGTEEFAFETEPAAPGLAGKGGGETQGEGDALEEIAGDGIEEIIEVVEDLDSVQPEVADAATGATEELLPEGELEEIPADQYAETQSVAEELPAGEVIEIAIDDSGAQPIAIPPEETIAGEPAVEEVVADDTIVETGKTLPDDYALEEVAAEGEQEEIAEVELVEATAGDEVEEIIEELVGEEEEVSAGQDKTGEEAIDTDLRNRADILAELASAAKALEKIGPDLSNSFFSESEIREKAKLLSEEFDRYLSVREKFYNQHILIKRGNYLVGAAGRGEKEFPEHLANLREFYIGKFPVTNALFEIFVEKTGYITTAERYGFGTVYIPRMQKTKNARTGAESFIWNSQLQHKKIPGACWYRPHGPSSTLYVKRTHPVVQVSLEDACAFAAWTGKRIPTEPEWEAAARTSCSYLYPWGNIWQDDACNLEKSLCGDTTPVDQYVKFANEYEVADILGNVLEWTLDPWQESAQQEESEETYVVKGASWISGSEVCLTDRQPIYKDTSSNILGFRCIAI